MGVFKTKAMIHSLNDFDDVMIIRSHDSTDMDIIAKYKDKLCTTILNPYNGYYYVDDVDGIIKED
jgi:hypothetical protein